MKTLKINFAFCLLLIFAVSCTEKTERIDDMPDWYLNPDSVNSNATCVAVGEGNSKAEALTSGLSAFSGQLETRIKTTEAEHLDSVLATVATVSKGVFGTSFNNVAIRTLIKKFSSEKGDSDSLYYFESVKKLTFIDGNRSFIIKFSQEEVLDSSGCNLKTNTEITSKNASLQDVIDSLEAFGIDIEFARGKESFYTMLSSTKDINNLISGVSTDSTHTLEMWEEDLDKDFKSFDKFKSSEAFEQLEGEVKKFEEFKNSKAVEEKENDVKSDEKLKNK